MAAAAAAQGSSSVVPPVRFVQALFVEFIGTLAVALAATLSAFEENSYIAVGCAIIALSNA